MHAGFHPKPEDGPVEAGLEWDGLEIKPDFMLNDVLLEGGNVELFGVVEIRSVYSGST